MRSYDGSFPRPGPGEDSLASPTTQRVDLRLVDKRARLSACTDVDRSGTGSSHASNDVSAPRADCVVVDARPDGCFDGLALGTIAFAAEGSHVAYAIRGGDRWAIVTTGASALGGMVLEFRVCRTMARGWLTPRSIAVGGMSSPTTLSATRSMRFLLAL